MTLPAIRITEVRIHRLDAPLRERFGWSLNWTSRRTATLVEVRTDAGLTGWGDGYFGGDVLRAHPELVIGRSPFEAEAIYDSLRPFVWKQARTGASICGGLDTALWDSWKGIGVAGVAVVRKGVAGPRGALLHRALQEGLAGPCPGACRRGRRVETGGLPDHKDESWIRPGYRRSQCGGRAGGSNT